MNEIVSFGDWVRQRRKVLGLTQAELAKQVGCAVVTIKKIEQEERRPSPQMAQLLADRLAIPPSLQDDFLKMGRGQFVAQINSFQEALLPPAFLQQKAPSTQQGQPPFVTRQRELAQLDRRLTAALAGDGKVIFILGEAGRGKTRLMTEFSRRAQETHPNLVVAEGHCNDQAGSGTPYLPFQDVMEMLTGNLEARWMTGNLSQAHVLRLWNLLPHTIQAIIERGPALVDTLIPGMPLIRRITPYIVHPADWIAEIQALVEAQRAQTIKIEQGDLLDQVTQVLQTLATRQPLLLLLDDLQWVDDASKNLLFHLGRRLPGCRILILGAYRPSEIALGRPSGDSGQIEQHPLELVINEFKRHFGDIQMDLGRMIPSEGRAFTDALLDSQPNCLDQNFRENLFGHAKGHPLFTVEILRNLQENGSLIQDEAGRWVVSDASAADQLPARVEAVIEQRINRLDERLRDVLTVASVEGEVFTVQVICCILEMDERLLLHRLASELGQRHRLVQEHSEVVVSGQPLNRYQFGHVLFQEYLYHRLTQGERRLYHREVGRALEEVLFARDPSQINVQPAQPFEEVEENSARADSGFPDAFIPSLAHHFWRGQEWIKAASYATRAGKNALQTYALREAMAYFERALQSLDKIPDPPVVLVYEAIIGWIKAAFQFKPYQEQLHQLARAEKIARALNDIPRLVEALYWTAEVYLAKGLWTRAGPALTESLDLAEGLGNDRLAVRPIYFRALMTTFVNPRSSLAFLNRALELARLYHDRTIEALTLGTKSQIHAQMGEFSLSRENMRRAYETLQNVDSPLTESDVDLLAAWAYLAMGDLQHGLEYGQRSVQKAIATDNLECICSGFNCIGFANLEMNQISEAASAFQEAVGRSETIGAFIHKCLGRAGLAMAQFLGGRADAIQELETGLAEMQGYNHPVGAANVAQMLGACLILSGDLERAESYLNMACDFYRRSEMIPYLIRSLLSLAQLFEEQKHFVKAQITLAEAETLKHVLIPE